jgi:hypothetical protein
MRALAKEIAVPQNYASQYLCLMKKGYYYYHHHHYNNNNNYNYYYYYYYYYYYSRAATEGNRGFCLCVIGPAFPAVIFIGFPHWPRP